MEHNVAKFWDWGESKKIEEYMLHLKSLFNIYILSMCYVISLTNVIKILHNVPRCLNKR